jgi:hypothetical protein
LDDSASKDASRFHSPEIKKKRQEREESKSANKFLREEKIPHHLFLAVLAVLASWRSWRLVFLPILSDTNVGEVPWEDVHASPSIGPSEDSLFMRAG